MSSFANIAGGLLQGIGKGGAEVSMFNMKTKAEEAAREKMEAFEWARLKSEQEFASGEAAIGRKHSSDENALNNDRQDSRYAVTDELAANQEKRSQESHDALMAKYKKEEATAEAAKLSAQQKMHFDTWKEINSQLESIDKRMESINKEIGLVDNPDNPLYKQLAGLQAQKDNLLRQSTEVGSLFTEPILQQVAASREALRIAPLASNLGVSDAEYRTISGAKIEGRKDGLEEEERLVSLAKKFNEGHEQTTIAMEIWKTAQPEQYEKIMQFVDAMGRGKQAKGLLGRESEEVDLNMETGVATPSPVASEGLLGGAKVPPVPKTWGSLFTDQDTKQRQSVYESHLAKANNAKTPEEKERLMKVAEQYRAKFIKE